MVVIVSNRLVPDKFRLPVEKLRAGYKSDTYFNRTGQILSLDRRSVGVTMQLFQKVPDAVVCGVDHALAILAVGTGWYKNPYTAKRLFRMYLELEKEVYGLWRDLSSVEWEEFSRKQRELFDVSKELDDLWVNGYGDLKIEALYDGESVGARQPVMLIRGDIKTFVHLETPYLGALTDGTMVCTNTRDVIRAASGKPVYMFGARHQSAESQAGSGYAAYVGGATGVSTDEQGEFWESRGNGTIPHVLIASYGGDTVLATKKFDEYMNITIRRVSLVDFENDSVRTSIEVARAVGNLYAVRLDTSENMVDECFKSLKRGGYYEIKDADGQVACVSEDIVRGVNEYLVQAVRRGLDEAGFPGVKIFVSGGFTPEKIRRFEDRKVPVDIYGIGSSLFDRRGGKFEYTADVVEPVAKAGRGLWEGPALHQVDTSIR